MQETFDLCVFLLEELGEVFNMSYVEINIWLFCIIMPIAFIAMTMMLIYQHGKIKTYRKFFKLEKPYEKIVSESK